MCRIAVVSSVLAVVLASGSAAAQGGRGGQRGTPIRPGEQCPPGTTEIRPRNCMAPEFAPPSILDYRPRSTLIAPEHPVPRAKYPVIDFHGHAQGRLESRENLESLGASLAAAHVTEEALEELEELNRQLAESTNEEAAQAANRRFHFRIYELTESPVLLAQLNLLWRTLGSGPHVDRPIAESVRQHAEIIEALRARDGDRAAAATARARSARSAPA